MDDNNRTIPSKEDKGNFKLEYQNFDISKETIIAFKKLLFTYNISMQRLINYIFSLPDTNQKLLVELIQEAKKFNFVKNAEKAEIDKNNIQDALELLSPITKKERERNANKP